MSDDRRRMWNERYAQADLLWSAAPNRFVAEELSDLKPGRALDLGAGEGRNAIWLAGLGWNVTAVDFSDAAIAKGRARAEPVSLNIEWLVEDLLEYRPEERAFDLVLIAYIHLPPAEQASVLQKAASAVAAGGTFFLVGHDPDNITKGVGGPQNPALLYSAEDVVRQIGPLEIVRAEQALRPVVTDEGEKNAIDVVVRAVRTE